MFSEGVFCNIAMMDHFLLLGCCGYGGRLSCSPEIAFRVLLTILHLSASVDVVRCLGLGKLYVRRQLYLYSTISAVNAHIQRHTVAGCGRSSRESCAMPA